MKVAIATLQLEGSDTLSLPVYSETLGPDVVDVDGLTKHNPFTYDPGFDSTAACASEITFLDGDKGQLLHRGYPIDQLAEHSNHLELCYFLLNGELPTKERNEEFFSTVTHHTNTQRDYMPLNEQK